MAKQLLFAAAKAKVAGNKKPSLVVLAYSGGIMAPPGWGDVAIDLTGLQVEGRVPMLADHANLVNAVAGSGAASIADWQLYVAGPISSATEAGQTILALVRDEVELHASVGLRVLSASELAPGESVQINGRTITAPARGLVVISSAVLQEVSIVPLGADPQTKVTLAAKREADSMAKVPFVEAPPQTQIAADGSANDPVMRAALGGQRPTAATLPDDRELRARETERVNGISRALAEFGKPTIEVEGVKVDLEAHAIRNNWTAAEAGLYALRAARPQTGPVIGGRQEGTLTAQHIEAALLARAGQTAVAEKKLGEKVMEQSFHLHAASVVDLCRAALQLDGQQVPLNRNDLIRASLSTGSMPVALGNAMNKSMEAAYNDSPATWRKFCAVRPAADFKDNTSIRPWIDGGLQLVPKGGQLDHATFGETTYTWAVDTFARMITYDRRDVINDNLNVLSETGPAFGKAGARAVADLIYNTLIAAGAHYSAGNKNLLAGGVAVSGVLSVDTLAVLIKKMRSQRDAQNNDLDIQPQTLLVSPDNETVGKAALESEFIERAVNTPTGNPLRKAVALEVESRLGNTAKFPTVSAAAWYLFAGPGDVPMIAGFLDGKQTPTVEFFGFDQVVDALQVSWRVVFDFGAALGDPKASAKGDGVAAS